MAHQDVFDYESNQTPNYEICKRLCKDYRNCTAMVVYQNRCYFKNGDCQNNQQGKSGATTFISQGDVKEMKA